MADTKKLDAQDSAPADEGLVPAARLIAEAQDFLGVEPHVVAGALHGINDPELTVDAARERVNAWLATPAKEN